MKIINSTIDTSNKSKGILLLLILSLTAITGSVIAYASDSSGANDTRNVITQRIVPKTHQERVELFHQAIVDDLAGRSRSARDNYDALKSSEMSNIIAVPSAVNQVSLGKFDTAKREFDALKNSSNIRDKEYAQLWQLWLTARTHTGHEKALESTLAKMGAKAVSSSLSQQAIINLYAGTGSVEAVFNAAATMPVSGDLQRKDALTEATFFTSGYLLYVKHDSAAAKKILQQNITQLSDVSLEKPLITREMTAL